MRIWKMAGGALTAAALIAAAVFLGRQYAKAKAAQGGGA